MESAAIEKHAIRTNSVFLMLSATVYERFWSGRALRVWEIMLWSIAAVYLGLNQYLLLPEQILIPLTWSSWGALLYLTPLILAIWDFRASLPCGTSDEILRTAPVTGWHVIGSRFLIVVTTWIRIFAPIFVVLLCSITNVNTPDLYLPHPYPVAILQILGWMLLFASWGFLTFSFSGRRHGQYSAIYFGIPFGLLIAMYFAKPYFRRMPALEDLWYNQYRLWPEIIEKYGIHAIWLSALLLLAAVFRWGRRK